MKKFLLTLLLVVSLVSVLQAVTLEYWTWDPDLKERTETMIGKFEAENPGIEINLTVMEPGDYWTKIRLMAMTKKLPDVFNMSSGYLEEWSSNGFLYNLDEFVANDLNEEDFYLNLIEGGKKIANKNNAYAVPFALVTTVLFYNKDMFDAAGIAYPDSNWTWNEFLVAAKKLTIDKDNDGKTDQWGFWLYGRYAHTESWIYRNGGEIVNRETMRFEPDANALETLEFLSKLVNEYKVAPMPKDMAGVRQQDVFPRGLAAMWIDGSWNIDNNRIIAGDTVNWGIAEVPLGPNGDANTSYSWPDFTAISATTKNAEAAWKFLKFSTGEGMTMDMYMAGKIPSYIPLATSDEFYDATQQPAEMNLLLDIAAKDMYTSFTKGWGEWRGYGAAEGMGFNGLLDAVYNGETDLETALGDMDKNINKILKRIYK